MDGRVFGGSCAAQLRDDFRGEPGDPRWTHISIVWRGRSIDRAGIVEIPLRVCLTFRGRHVRHPVAPERIHLRRGSRGWQIVKPGLTITDIELGQAYPDDPSLYPPANPAVPDPPVWLPAPAFSCPGRSVYRADPTGDVVDENHHRITNRPGFDLTGISVSRRGTGAVCVTVGLGGRPRADAVYDIGLAGAGSPNYAGIRLVVDGAGGVHEIAANQGLILHPGVRPHLPAWGWTGTALVFRVQSSPWTPLPPSHLSVKASSGGTLVPLEPLVSNPYRYDGVPDGTCLRFPSGTLGGPADACPDPSA